LTHASRAPAGQEAYYWAVCIRTPILVGVPVLGLTLLLAFGAYPTNPVLTGALAGLGAGLMSDGSWRTFCDVCDPVDALAIYTASVLLLTIGGMLVGWLAARRSTRPAFSR
jgi:hypothetical protein